MPDAPTPRPNREIPVLRGRPFLLSSIGFFAFLALLLTVAGGLASSWSRHTWPLRTADVGATADTAWDNGPPQLQTHAANDLKTLREREDQHLHTLKWTDPGRAYAVIPIEDAMSLLVDAQAHGQLNQVLPAPQPATPVDLQVQKSREVLPAPREP